VIFFWLKQLLKELQFGEVTQMTLICDNQAALHINLEMAIGLGSQILGMCSISFKIICALKKLYPRASNLFRIICILPNMSSMFSPFFHSERFILTSKSDCF